MDLQIHLIGLNFFHTHKSTNSLIQINITVNNVNINSVDSVKLLGVVMDNKLNFVEHYKEHL